MGADQGDEEVVTGHRRHRDRQDDQQVPVAVRHDTADHDRGEQRYRQREGLQQDGKDDHAAGQDTLAEDGPQVTIWTGPVFSAPGEAGVWLEDDRDAGIGPAERADRDDAASQGRIHHGDALPRDLLEHDEMVEVPVQNRSRGEAGEVAGLGLDPPCHQAVLPGGRHDAGRADSVPAGAGRVPQFFQRNVPSVIGQGHGQARGGAVSQLQLCHVGDRPTHRQHQTPAPGPSPA
jgi:hypothetical protein